MINKVRRLHTCRDARHHDVFVTSTLLGQESSYWVLCRLNHLISRLVCTSYAILLGAYEPRWTIAHQTFRHFRGE